MLTDMAYHTGIFIRVQAFFDIPEIVPVKDKVDDDQGCKYETGIVVHCQPLVTGDFQIC